MKLNEYLKYTLGVYIEDKYNRLAIEEVLANQDKYPLIYEDILNMVICDENNNIVDVKLESHYFDCAAFDIPSFNITYELYKAFIRVFAKDIKDTDFNVNYASFCVDYFRCPDFVVIIYPKLNYSGYNYISIYNDKKEIGNTIIHHVDENDVLFCDSSSSTHFSYYNDYSNVLEKIKDGFKVLIDTDCFFENRLNENELYNRVKKLDDGVYGYACDRYEIGIGDNLLVFFSTERGYDTLSLLRLPILDTLNVKEIETEAVKGILYI